MLFDSIIRNVLPTRLVSTPTTRSSVGPDFIFNYYINLLQCYNPWLRLSSSVDRAVVFGTKGRGSNPPGAQIYNLRNFRKIAICYS